MSFSRASEFVGSEHAADGVADSVFLARPEVAVDVEGDFGGLVAEGRLHLLHVATRVDQSAREEVTQVVEGDRLSEPGASASSSQLVAEVGDR